jgi:hypothetical protein
MARGKKIQRKEKPKREKWVVVGADGQLKYPPKLGSEAEGYDKAKAVRLAEPAHESHAYYAVPIGYWKGEHEEIEGLDGGEA